MTAQEIFEQNKNSELSAEELQNQIVEELISELNKKPDHPRNPSTLVINLYYRWCMVCWYFRQIGVDFDVRAFMDRFAGATDTEY